MDAWEGIAERLLEEHNLEPPIDPYDVVVALKLDVRISQRAMRPTILGRVIVVPAAQRPEREGFAVLHEIGHYIARQHGDSSEHAANALASSLLMPRTAYGRDVRDARWSLFELKRRHPHASYEALARRIVALREAILVVADRAPERRQYRIRSRALGPRLARPLPIEERLIEAADATGEVQGPCDLLRAWPIIDGDARRVLLVGDVETLEMASGA